MIHTVVVYVQHVHNNVCMQQIAKRQIQKFADDVTYVNREV